MKEPGVKARAVNARKRSAPAARDDHDLEPHSGPMRLDGPQSWFLPVPEMVESIVRAVSLVVTPGSLDFARFSNAARCPLPPYRQMNQLYRDAFGVLAGNPFATRRFIDGLELKGESGRVRDADAAVVLMRSRSARTPPLVPADPWLGEGFGWLRI
jgi:hypothetical protein